MKPFQKIGLVLAAAILLSAAGAAVYRLSDQRTAENEILSGRQEQSETLVQTREEDSSEPLSGDTEKETGTEDESGVTPETESEPESGTRAETGTEIETEAENGFVVAIDPGHQGSWVDMSEQEPNGPGSSEYKANATTGTTGSYTGVPEYQLNLDISLSLREELEERGYQVVMTREDHDTAISNAERALMAAEQGGDIYVRIHANGSDDSSVSGALGMSPSPENPYIPELYEDSYRLTECILNAYCEATGFSNLGVQYYDNMTGINWSKIPVTILEMGFMTNQQDDLNMADSAYRQKMVEGIVSGVNEYYQQ